MVWLWLAANLEPTAEAERFPLDPTLVTRSYPGEWLLDKI